MSGCCRAASFLASLGLSLFVYTNGFCASLDTLRDSEAPSQILTKSPVDSTESRLLSAYGALPMAFEPNRGQSDSTVQFLAHGSGYNLYLTGQEAVMVFTRLDGQKPRSGKALLNKLANSAQSNPTAVITQDATPSQGQSAVVRLRFVGARADSAVIGEAPHANRSNYFIGSDASRHITDVPNFARVRYTELYPGIDLVYYGNQRQLEYDFVLAPGADPAKIALTFDGANEVVIDAQGDLLLHTALGDIKQQRPQLYQEVNGQRKAIDGRYVRRPGQTIGVEVAAYDASKPLTIDPVLSYSSFIGGSSSDYGTAIAVDASGNAYITGYTSSTNFPVASPYQKALGRSAKNVFVTKLNATGSGIVYSTYIGGASETDYASGIAVDSTGAVYITGTTTGSGFPTTTSAYQKGASGGGSFVAKLSAAGNALVYSTYVLKASAKSIAVDGSNSAYIAGAASSAYIATTGAFQTKTHSTASTNAFVLKLNAAGTAASYS